MSPTGSGNPTLDEVELLSIDLNSPSFQTVLIQQFYNTAFVIQGKFQTDKRNELTRIILNYRRLNGLINLTFSRISDIRREKDTSIEGEPWVTYIDVELRGFATNNDLLIFDVDNEITLDKDEIIHINIEKTEIVDIDVEDDIYYEEDTDFDVICQSRIRNT